MRGNRIISICQVSLPVHVTFFTDFGGRVRVDREWERHGGHTVVVHGGQQRDEGPRPCSREGARGGYGRHSQTQVRLS